MLLSEVDETPGWAGSQIVWLKTWAGCDNKCFFIEDLLKNVELDIVFQYVTPVYLILISDHSKSK